jgi:hypothetical protein
MLSKVLVDSASQGTEVVNVHEADIAIYHLYIELYIEYLLHLHLMLHSLGTAPLQSSHVMTCSPQLSSNSSPQMITVTFGVDI